MQGSQGSGHTEVSPAPSHKGCPPPRCRQLERRPAPARGAGYRATVSVSSRATYRRFTHAQGYGSIHHLELAGEPVRSREPDARARAPSRSVETLAGLGAATWLPADLCEVPDAEHVALERAHVNAFTGSTLRETVRRAGFTSWRPGTEASVLDPAPVHHPAGQPAAEGEATGGAFHRIRPAMAAQPGAG
jgi:hypothetical protein